VKENSSVTQSSAIIQPASTSELAEIIRQAVADSEPLCVSRSGPLDSHTQCRPLSLERMQAVVDYPARDMTITVQAGMTVARLREILAAEHQQLPIDCCDPQMTVGALVASDVSGPRQFGRGTLRDYLIGMEAVDGQGRVFHAGGRVVKNVAGYDLCRLMVGSRGTLGVLTQLTFKVVPIPEHSLVTSFHYDSRQALAESLDRLNQSKAVPVVLDFDCRNSQSCYLHIGLEGSSPDICTWQSECIAEDCHNGQAASVAQDVPQYCSSFSAGWDAFDIRIRTLPSKLPAIVHALAERGIPSVGHAGNGIILIDNTSHDETLRTTCEALVQEHGGNVVQWAVDHPGTSDNMLTRRLRQTFDPHSVFTI
jgi:glycolate oxidase FAD binding subunit